jgi:hypothetical protein
MSDLTVPFVLTERDRTWAREQFPGYNVLSGSGQLSSHPRLHIERMVAEDLAYRALHLSNTEIVVDIGGSPSRHNALRRRGVWCCCPVISAQDVNRASRVSKYKNVCLHRVQECSCVNPAAYLSVHSIYYLTEADVIKLAKAVGGRFMVVCHDFVGQSGRFHENEGVWRRRPDGYIEMSVAGCNFAYVHRSVDWFVRGSIFSYLHGQAVVTRVKEVGTMSIYSVTYHDGYKPAESPSISIMPTWG